MKKLLNVYKPQGRTPLEVIKKLKQQFLEYQNQPIGYAGRLDPLAHGVLLLMIGEEATKQRDAYLNLPKEYEFEAVFGVKTDTYDALGLVENQKVNPIIQSETENHIKEFIKTKLGQQNQTYPPYSSKTVKGKPLFWWAKANKLSEIEIPKRNIEIYHFNLIKIYLISASDLQKEIVRQIDSVTGDFRQEEIKKGWQEFFAKNENQMFHIARFSIACSSGTYVRSLVNELGEKLGTGAIALEILRTQVGNYPVENSIRV